MAKTLLTDSATSFDALRQMASCLFRCVVRIINIGVTDAR